jgi:hypothetical protein
MAVVLAREIISANLTVERMLLRATVTSVRCGLCLPLPHLSRATGPDEVPSYAFNLKAALGHIMEAVNIVGVHVNC